MDAVPPIDPQSTHLRIGDGGIVPFGQYGWRALGECIGSHEHLQKLIFDSIETTHENLEALLTGVSRNRTVRKLNFCHCHGEWPLGILAAFFQSNQNLSLLNMAICGGGISSSLSAALRGCTSSSLQKIDCDWPHEDDEAAAEFFEALAGLPQLKKLKLTRCDIGLRGWGALAALLRRPACVLQEIFLLHNDIGDEGLAMLEPLVATSSTLIKLSLGGIDCSAAAVQSFSGVLRSPTCMLKNLHLGDDVNNIGDDEIISFADALATNSRLEELDFSSRRSPWSEVSDIGFAAMTRALCNKSSIGDLYSSNHTLQKISSIKMPRDLWSYLRMNESQDKSLVARKKILMHFFKGDFSMEPFHVSAMAPNILPHLLSWIGRTPDGESFAPLFNFLRRMPSVWGDRRPVLRRSRRKRKVPN